MSYDDGYGGSLTSDPIPTTTVSYPEHEKLAKVKDRSQAIGEFLDWLMNEQGAFLCKHHTHDEGCECADNWHVEVKYGDTLRCPTCDSGRRLRRRHVCGMLELYPNPVHRTIQDWLAAYFDIDQGKIEQEKRDMLEAVRQGRPPQTVEGAP